MHTLMIAHPAIPAVAHPATLLIAQACDKADPVCAKLSTYAGWMPNWLQYLWVIGIVIAVVIGVIGHRAGWSHMKEVITGLIVASILISSASAFVS